eukprot:PhM_4_TR1222/c0_g3_i1/m.24347/K01880/GARS, glyS1; glycyl-tRNA synthetase
MSRALPGKLVNFVREEFEGTCRRRFFFGPAFEPYGGTAGLYDLGPSVCALKANLLTFWRQHFVFEENMCEIDATCMTPEEVFLTSGHVDRFLDIMVRDTKTGECLRLDKYVEEFCEKRLNDPKLKLSTEESTKLAHLFNAAGDMNKEQLGAIIKEYNLVSPSGNPLSEPFDFNLMFASTIGPAGDRRGYLRPELAQGICLNFKRLLESNNAGRLPFAACAVGQAFRNEIAPRASLIRVREFTLAEIEHFVNPNKKEHEKFGSVANLTIWVWPREQQLKNEEPFEATVGDLVARKIIDNETLGYFIGRVAIFMELIGMKFLRFRQHRANEMAFYAQDCWDCELLTSYGWVECVGIADRSAHDLTVHSKKTKKDLSAWEDYPEPVVQKVLDRKINKGILGKTFGKKVPDVVEALMGVPEDRALAIDEELNANPVEVSNCNGDTFKITREMVKFTVKEEKVSGRSFIPNVVEPSFGLGRIIYSLLEQSYWIRRDESGKNEQRAVFSFSASMAPFKVALLPLMVKDSIQDTLKTLRASLGAAGVSYRYDDSGAAIGKKYARMDELGIPFAVTVDFENDGCVTLRERDSTQQVRVPLNEVVMVIAQLCRIDGSQWSEVYSKYPAQEESK